MTKILQFDENLLSNVRAFINPNGKIIYFQDKTHEQMAKDYLDYLIQSNSLLKDDLLILKQWINLYQQKHYKDLYADFLILVCHFDKVESIKHKTITTTILEPYTRFYNYYLMDFEIIHTFPINFNFQTNTFERENNEFVSMNYSDREIEEEINDIKKHILKKDRSLFFK